MTYQNLTGNWNYPTNIKAGAGTISQLADSCKQLGIQAPLLITDPGLSEFPMISEAITQCKAAGLDCGLFSNIKGNPTKHNVMNGVEAYNNANHDGVIAFGGGSGIDAAKAVALMAGQERPLWDFEDIGENWTRANEASIAPIVAIPTTAGTGSEVGRSSVITDESQQVKRIIFHPGMLPSLVILDPELTISLPTVITAATGMDALSHNIEALCSPFYHPMAEGIAVEGIRLVKEHLPLAVANGSDTDARMQMLVASTMGATAFQKGLGGMHALAHPLGALYDAHHGMLNAILMPYVLNANRELIEDRIDRTARYIGLEDPSFDGFLNWVLAIRQQIGIPHSLDTIDIDDRQAEKIGQMATEDPSATGNPFQFSAIQYTDIFIDALRGDL